MKITKCSECDFVHSDTRKQHYKAWMCVRHKNLIPNFISDEAAEPYLRCYQVNGGACELFKPRKES